jgi:hypothetical protein
MNEEQLQKLLRARAKVDVPADYAEKLLESLHERQRAVLLQKPLWRIAAERLGTFLSEHSLSAPAYAVGLAAVFALGLAAISLIKPAAGGPAMARQKTSAPTPLSPPVETQTVSFEKPSN